jgi:hypothetical protein
MANPKSTRPTPEQTQGTPDLFRQVINSETGISMLMEVQAALGRLEERVSAQTERLDDRLKANRELAEAAVASQEKWLSALLNPQKDAMTSIQADVKDLLGWKNKLLGIAIAISVFSGGFAYLLNRVFPPAPVPTTATLDTLRAGESRSRQNVDSGSGELRNPTNAQERSEAERRSDKNPSQR